MATNARPAVLLMQINGSQGGRDEKYLIPLETNVGLSTLDAIAKNIVFGRTAFFATGTKLVYARTSVVGGPPDRRVVKVKYPLGPHPAFSNGGGPYDAPGPSNDDNVAIYMTSQLTTNAWANHYYNFVPDNWITGMSLAAEAVLDYLQVAPGGEAASLGLDWAGSHKDLCQQFWLHLKNHTVSGKRITSTNYTTTGIDDWIFRNVTRHNVGRFRGEHRGRRASTQIS